MVDSGIYELKKCLMWQRKKLEEKEIGKYKIWIRISRSYICRETIWNSYVVAQISRDHIYKLVDENQFLI